MAVNIQAVRNYYGGLSGVDDATITAHLEKAQRRVVTDGVSAGSDCYDDLVIQAIGSSMSTGGVLVTSAGDVTKEKVHDVEISYGGSSGASGGTRLSYEDEYQRLLNNCLGMEGRIGRIDSGL